MSILADHHWSICVPLPIARQKKTILFVCLPWHPFLLWSGCLLSSYPSWHAPSSSNSALLLLGGISSPHDTYFPLSLGFMGLSSTPYFVCFHYFGPTAAHSHFSKSYTAHGLLFLSFRTPLNPFISSRPICLSHGPVIHYPCCLEIGRAHV